MFISFSFSFQFIFLFLFCSLSCTLQASKILVVGGGAAGIELVGELSEAQPNAHITLIHGHEQLLPGNLTPAYKEEVLQQLRALPNVEVILEDRVVLDDLTQTPNLTYVRPTKPVTTSKGRTLEVDVVVFCSGGKVNTKSLRGAFGDKLDEGGHVKVNEFLQLEGEEKVFAIGDCANVNETKRGVSARRQANHVVTNIRRLHTGQPLLPYSPKSAGLSLTIGRGGAIQPPLGLNVFVGSSVTSLVKSYNLGAYRGWKLMNFPRPDQFKPEDYLEVPDKDKLARWAKILGVTEAELETQLTQTQQQALGDREGAAIESRT